MNQTDIEEIDKSQEHESDGPDASESDTEEPLDDTSIRNLIKRFKMLHHQLAHEGRKENVPILLAILNILQYEVNYHCDLKGFKVFRMELYHNLIKK